MLNILAFALELINQHAIWLYLACLVVILFNVRSYALARRERANTIFTIEKEVAAHKEGKAMSSIGALLGVAVVITLAKFYIIPSVDLSQVIEPTPTLPLFIPTRAPLTATPTVTPDPPTPTARPLLPTRLPTPTPELITPTAAPPLPPACPNAKARITSPGVGMRAAGLVTILGTANVDSFQFYKIEYGIGTEPTNWNVVGDLSRNAVVNGMLGQIDTRALPNGVAWIQLTVVDRTGNFPTPCRVRIIVQN